MLIYFGFNYIGNTSEAQEVGISAPCINPFGGLATDAMCIKAQVGISPILGDEDLSVFALGQTSVGDGRTITFVSATREFATPIHDSLSVSIRAGNFRVGLTDKTLEWANINLTARINTSVGEFSVVEDFYAPMRDSTSTLNLFGVGYKTPSAEILRGEVGFQTRLSTILNDGVVLDTRVTYDAWRLKTFVRGVLGTAEDYTNASVGVSLKL